MIFQSSDPEPIYPVVYIYHYFESNPCGVPPGKTVFVDPITEKSITFGEFQRETKHFAAGLQDTFGFQPREVLAILSCNQVCASRQPHAACLYYARCHAIVLMKHADRPFNVLLLGCIV